jgi:hypothetical protein
VNKLIVILWPSFIVGGVAEVLFFTAFDPADLEMSRTAAYTAGFFFFWACAAGSSALTCFLQRSASEINQKVDG